MDTPTNPLIAASLAVLGASMTALGFFIRWLLRRQSHLENRVDDCTEAHIKVAVLENKVADLEVASISADITADLDGTILAVNDGFTLLFGWTREEAIGKKVEMLISGPSVHRHHLAIGRRAAEARAGNASRLPVRVNDGIGQDRNGRHFAVIVEVGLCDYNQQLAWRAHVQKISV